MSRPTLLDIAIRNGSDAAVGLIDETVKAHPEIKSGEARTIKGQNYKTKVRVALPADSTNQFFRAAGDGADPIKSTYQSREVGTYILNPRWECDKAVADRDEDGAASYIYDEAVGIMEAAMQSLASQFYYGRDGHGAQGHPGLVDSVLSTMTVDAGGTTVDTASSVWAVCWGRKKVCWVWGEGGQLEMDDPRIETITGENSKSLTGYVQELLTYPGLQVGDVYSIGRIRDLTEDSGKGLTDTLIYQLLSKFPVGRTPDVLLMSRRSQEQLRSSRTATNAKGDPAPTPENVGGIPIAVTDAIVDTEALS